MEENNDTLLPTYVHPKKENSKLVMTSKVLFFFSLAFSSFMVVSLFMNSVRVNFIPFDDGVSPYKYD